MTGTIWSHVAAAGLSVNKRGDLAEDGTDRLPGLLGATGHDGRALERPFLSTGNTGTDIVKTLLLEGFLAALGVGPETVAAVDDDVTFLKQRNELFDDGVHGGTRLHHDHRLAGPCEGSDEFLECLGGNDPLSLGAALRELLGHGRGAVENADGESLALHVEDEVLAHDGEADEADVALIAAHNGW